MHKQTILSGSVWLIASALTAKVLGAVFRIPLTAMLGGTGMGYYAAAYGLFLPVFSLSVTGMNTAVAALTAQYLGRNDPAGAARIPKLARRMFGTAGAAGSVFLFLSAPLLCRAMHNPGALPAVRAFSPAVWLCCLNAVLRGEAEGRCSMIPTAVSQAVESAARLFLGLWLCRAVCREPDRFLAYLPAGTAAESAAAAAAVFGVTLSAAAGTVTLLIMRRRIPANGTAKHSDAAIRRALWRLLLPVAAASLVTNLTTLIDLVTGIRLMTVFLRHDPASRRYGCITPEAAAVFCCGAFSGMAVTVFNLVPSVTNHFGKSVLPAFAESYARQRPDETAFHAQTVMRRTSFLAVPAGLGITALAAPILSVLFPTRLTEAAAAAPALTLLGPAVIFTAMVSPVFSMLQAAGRAGDTVPVMLTGACVKLAGNLLLMPRFGLRGTALSTCLCYAVIWLRASAIFYRRTGIRLTLRKICGRPFFAGMLCAGTALALFPLLSAEISQSAALFLSIGAGGLCYLTVSCVLKPEKLDTRRTLRYNSIKDCRMHGTERGIVK